MAKKLKAQLIPQTLNAMNMEKWLLANSNVTSAPNSLNLTVTEKQVLGIGNFEDYWRVGPRAGMVVKSIWLVS